MDGIANSNSVDNTTNRKLGGKPALKKRLQISIKMKMLGKSKPDAEDLKDNGADEASENANGSKIKAKAKS